MHLPHVEPAEEPAQAPTPHVEPPALIPPVPAVLQPSSEAACRAGPCCLQPTTHEEAMASDHAAHWQAAMDEEMASLEATPEMGLRGLPAHVSAIPVNRCINARPTLRECLGAAGGEGFKQRTASTTTRSPRPCHNMPPSVPCLLWPQTRIWR